MTKTFPYYPLLLDVEGRMALVVGGGNVALRKVETLLRYGARVVVVAPSVAEEITALSADGAVELRTRYYEAADLEGVELVIAATSSAEVNASIAAAARERRVPVNVVDVPQLSTFIVPAVIEDGAIQIAVSTGGNSPALARRLRNDLQQLVSGIYSEVNEVLGSLRKPAKETLATDTDRKRFFDSVLDGMLERLRSGDRTGAYRFVADRCAAEGVPLPEIVRSRLAGM